MGNGSCRGNFDENPEKAGSIIDGVTCGAGMPYKLSEIAGKYGIYYYPIVSLPEHLMLYGRDPQKNLDYLEGVVYEDPWFAGGHNGLSNNEDPLSSTTLSQS